MELVLHTLTINKLNGVDYLVIFFTDEDVLEEEDIIGYSDSIIGEFFFDKLCSEHGHASNSLTRSEKVSCQDTI